MLVIRLQRTGRKGHAMFRVVVQDARRSPTSGQVVAALGSYDPHAKVAILDKEKSKLYLEKGAQPSPRVASLLKSEGVKLPDWVNTPTKKSKTTRHPDKLQKAELAAPAAEAPAEPKAQTEEVAEATPETTEAPASEVESASEPDAEVPAAPAPETPADSAEPTGDKPNTST